jgi:hypothetical protein
MEVTKNQNRKFEYIIMTCAIIKKYQKTYFKTSNQKRRLGELSLLKQPQKIKYKKIYLNLLILRICHWRIQIVLTILFFRSDATVRFTIRKRPCCIDKVVRTI